MITFCNKKRLRGFTLVEIMMSLFIFLMIMTAASNIFVEAFQGYRNTRAVQRDLENAQFLLTSLAKELRTSSIVSPGTIGDVQSVKFYDHSQKLCTEYRLNSGSGEVQKASVAIATPIPPTRPTDICAATPLGSFLTVSTGTVSGHFVVTPSRGEPESPTPKRLGQVTITLQVNEGATHFARIQSTVSLRDYGHIGLELQ